MDIYAHKVNIPSSAITLDIKLKNPPYRKLIIRIDFEKRNIEIRNYNLYSNDMTVSFNELNIWDRSKKFKSTLKD